jgi:hypothetical protein
MYSESKKDQYITKNTGITYRQRTLWTLGIAYEVVPLHANVYWNGGSSSQVVSKTPKSERHLMLGEEYVQMGGVLTSERKVRRAALASVSQALFLKQLEADDELLDCFVIGGNKIWLFVGQQSEHSLGCHWKIVHDHNPKTEIIRLNDYYSRIKFDLNTNNPTVIIRW